MSVLVYSSRRAREQAERLLPEGAVLENLVASAISDGRVSTGSHAGFVFLDRHRVVARIERRAPRLRTRGPRAWVVTRVEQKKRTGVAPETAERRPSGPGRPGRPPFPIFRRPAPATFEGHE